MAIVIQYKGNKSYRKVITIRDGQCETCLNHVDVVHGDESVLEIKCEKCKNRVVSDHNKVTGSSLLLPVLSLEEGVIHCDIIKHF